MDWPSMSPDLNPIEHLWASSNNNINNNNMFNLYSAFPKLKDAVQKQKHSRQSIHIIVTVLSQSINQLSGQ